ncbi:MAG: hypothetical protein IJ533_04755 [Prevotella sp.]|nr:hypothetical protein [Prevotella sp.]
MKNIYIQPLVAKEELELEQMMAASTDLLIDIDKDVEGHPLDADSRLLDLIGTPFNMFE